MKKEKSTITFSYEPLNVAEKVTVTVTFKIEPIVELLKAHLKLLLSHY